MERLKRAPNPEAKRALGLWLRYQSTRRNAVGRQRRVLRRAYGRVRDRALPPWTPTPPTTTA